MGCQKDIAAKIVQVGGDYLLQIKANYKALHDELKLLCDEPDAAGFKNMRHARHQTVEKILGRI